MKFLKYLFLIPSLSLFPNLAYAEIILDKVTGAECSTRMESESSAVDVLQQVAREQDYGWIIPLKAITEIVKGKKITTIIYQAATRGQARPVGAQIEYKKDRAAELGVSIPPTKADRAEIDRIFARHKAGRSQLIEEGFLDRGF